MIGAVVGGIAGSRFGFHKLTFLSVFALSRFWPAFCGGGAGAFVRLCGRTGGAGGDCR